MKIKKDSWHYRFIKWTGKDPSPNLCNYFWQVVGPPLFVTLIALLLVIAVAGMIFEHGWSLLWMIPLGLLGGAVLILIIASVALGYETLREKYFGPKPVKEPKPEKEKKPNIFIEWLKAKKAKVCPILEFEDY